MKWVIWFTVAVHITWGVLLLAAPDPINTTPIHTLYTFVPKTSLLVAVLFSTAILAALGAKRNDFAPHIRVFLALPQQLLLIFTMIGGLTATITGQYADGVERSNLFILADQFPSMLLAFFYMLGLFDLAKDFTPEESDTSALDEMADMLRLERSVREDVGVQVPQGVPQTTQGGNNDLQSNSE